MARQGKRRGAGKGAREGQIGSARAEAGLEAGTEAGGAGSDALDASGQVAALAAAADAGLEAPSPAAAIGASADELQREQDRQSWRDAAVQFGSVARTLHPICEREWTDQRLGAFGDALAKCADHYGWKFGDVLSHPLAGLAAASFPLAWPFAQPFVMAALKDQKAKPAGAEISADPPPPASTRQTIDPVG